MSYSKKVLISMLVLILTTVISCGGDSSSKDNTDGSTFTPPEVTGTGGGSDASGNSLLTGIPGTISNYSELEVLKNKAGSSGFTIKVVLTADYETYVYSCASASIDDSGVFNFTLSSVPETYLMDMTSDPDFTVTPSPLIFIADDYEVAIMVFDSSSNLVGFLEYYKDGSTPQYTCLVYSGKGTITAQFEEDGVSSTYNLDLYSGWNWIIDSYNSADPDTVTANVVYSSTYSVLDGFTWEFIPKDEYLALKGKKSKKIGR